MAVHTVLLRPSIKKIMTATKTKSKARLRPTKPKPASGLQLLRNKEGVLYFRWPHDDGGPTKLVTYHIYSKGETYLSDQGIGEDDGLPVSLALEMKDLGFLYTGNGGPKSRRQAKRAASPRTSADARRSHGQSDPPKTNNQPKSNEAHRRDAESSRLAIRQVHLFKPAAGMLVFRVRAVGDAPAVQSRPLPKPEVRLALDSSLVAQMFHEFLAELKRQGWTECGRGVQWYERKLAKTR